VNIHDSGSKFGFITKFLHWLTIIFVFNQFFSINYYKYLPKSDPLKRFILVNWHKPMGFILLFITVLFILWRIKEKVRPSLEDISIYERIAAKMVHLAIFIFLFLQTVSGIIMSNASGYAIKIMGVAMPMFVAKDQALSKFAHEAHSILGGLLFLLILVHIFAALKHHFWDKNDILARMF
jgi:cytochrome b561